MLLVGDGPERGNVESLARQMGVIQRTACISWDYPDLENHLLGEVKRKPKCLIFLYRLFICIFQMNNLG